MRRKFARSIAAVCYLTVLFSQINAPLLQAATNTWTGLGADDNWSTGLNWSTTPNPPANDGTADIIFDGSTRLTPDVDAAWNVHSITFDATADAFVVFDNALTIQAGGIANNSTTASVETINNDISVAADQTWAANTSDLQLGGTVTLISALTVTGANNTIFAATSSLTGSGPLIKEGAGNLTFLGSSAGFTGDVTIGGTGTVTRSGAGTLPGNVNYTINSGTLDLASQALTMKRLDGSGGEIMLTSADLTVNQTASSSYGGVISGSGALIKDGTGKLELTGMNSYTGGTTVSAGILQGTAGVGLRGDIGNNANVTFNQTSGSGTYADIMNGTGSVTKIGNGTVILSGANTYAGGTSVGAGTLQGDTTSLQGGNPATTIDTAANARVSFTQDTDGTYQGTVTGAGGVVKDGTGTVKFTGTNTYAGATTITGGTFQLGDGGTTGAIGSGNVVDNATLAFNRTDTVNFDNVISGTGGLHQLGTGTVILGGTNTFTGATTIDAGTTLQVGNGGTSGTLGSGGTVKDNGKLVFDRSDTVTAPAAISGSGALVQMGTGTLILSGTNSYTGGTTVDAGTLQGTTASLQGNIVNNTAVVFDQSFNGSTAAVISGPGTLAKEGTGTAELSGVSTYTGATMVNAGVLNINGSISSDTTVNGAGTLGGTGTINNSVLNQGTVSAGSLASPIGTLHVTGNYTNDIGATMNVNIDSSLNGSVLNVDGTATINGGTVVANSTTGSANAGQKFVFLTAGSRVGTFDNATAENLPAFLIPVLGYTSDTAFFTLLRNGETYAAVGKTFNEKAVGRYLDKISPTASGDLQTIFDSLNSIDDPELRIAESQMAGSQHGTLGQIGIQNTTLIVAQVAQRLRSSSMTPSADPCCCQCNQCTPEICSGCLEGSLFAPVCPCGGSDWTGWGQGFGLGGSAKSDGNADGFGYGMGGVLAGVERWVDDSRLLGFYGGYVGSTARIDNLIDNINGGTFGGYLYADDGFNYWTAMSGFEFDSYSTHRPIVFDDIDRQANANYNGWQAYAYAERGVGYEACGHLFQPFVALQYIYLRQNSFTETGADSIDLAANGVNTNSLRSLVGARMQWAWLHRTCRRSFPEVHAYWMHEYLDSYSLIDATFSPTPEGGSSPFVAHGLDLGRDWAILGANYTWEMHGGWSMFVNGDVQTNNQATLYIGSGGLGHIW